MSTMARTEVRILREFAIQKAKSRSEFRSNLRSKDNNSNRTRAIIYEMPGIMLKRLCRLPFKILTSSEIVSFVLFHK